MSTLHNSTRCFRVVLACMARLNSERADATAAGLVGKRNGAGAAPPSSPPSPENRDDQRGARGGNAGGSAEGQIQQNGDRSTGDGGRSSAPTQGDEGRAVVSEAARGNRSAPSGASVAEWLPRKTGLAIELSSGRAFPVRFESEGRGPGWEVRTSRIFAGSREEPLTEVGAALDALCCPPSKMTAILCFLHETLRALRRPHAFRPVLLAAIQTREGHTSGTTHGPPFWAHTPLIPPWPCSPLLDLFLCSPGIRTTVGQHRGLSLSGLRRPSLAVGNARPPGPPASGPDVDLSGGRRRQVRGRHPCSVFLHAGEVRCARPRLDAERFRDPARRASRFPPSSGGGGGRCCYPCCTRCITPRLIRSI